MDLKHIEKLRPFQKFCITIGELPASYLESLTYLELLMWFIKFLQEQVIPAVNTNATAVQELQTLFTQLHDYVENYFDNLDVQEEIDHKLDELVEDGTLETLLTNYMKLTKIYNTTVEMIADYNNLLPGMNVKTLGYYNINDDGGATFKITNTESETEYQLSLDNNLYATMIIENEKINFRQLGAKTYQEDSTFDCKNIIDLYISICNKADKTFELYIPGGHWSFSPTLMARPKGVRITGDKTWSYGDIYGTAIHPLNNNQQYIWKLGGLADAQDNSSITISQMVKSCFIDGVCFTTYNGDNSQYFAVNNGVFIIDSTEFSTFDNIYFWHIIGNGLCIKSSWELHFGKISIRQHINPNTHSIYFMPTRPITNVSPNISALTIESLYFERNDGYIYSAPGSGFSHNYIGYINIETKFSSIATTFNTSEITDENESTYNPVDIIKGMYRYFTIGTIDMVFNDSSTGIVYDSNKWYLRSIIADVLGLENVNFRDKQFNIQVSQLCLSYGTDSSKCSVIYSRNMRDASQINIGSLGIENHMPQKVIDAFQSCNIRIGNYTATTSNYNTKDQIILKDYLQAWKYSVSMGTESGRSTVSTDTTAPTEFGLVIDKDATDASNGARFTYKLFKNSSDNTCTLKLIVKNKSDSQITISVQRVRNGATGYDRITVPASDNWQEITVNNFYADYNSTINILNYGNYKLALFKFE